MKTITMYELLGLVKDGKAPKKIRFDNTYWERKYGEKNVYYTNDTDSDLFIYFFRKNLTFTLNDTVEILEEKKIPEKIEDILHIDDLIPPYTENIEKIWIQTIKNHNKINEICDYFDEDGRRIINIIDLESKGE